VSINQLRSLKNPKEQIMKGMWQVVGVVVLMILTTRFLRPIQRLYDENPILVIAGIIITIVVAYTIFTFRKKYLERKPK
jgi:hypothetical protein